VAEVRPEAVLAWDGPLSPPRRNGEIVFDSLWESRVFGLTMTLYERGAFQWEEFRDRLIAAIGEWERTHDPQRDPYRYWDCWLAALERLLAEKDICRPAAIATRLADLSARPAGHDHE